MSNVADKRTVVLVHGWAGSADSWGPVEQRLLARPSVGRVLSVRLPGSPGWSGSEPTTVRGAVETVVAATRTVDGPVLLVGHSMGAQVTLLAAVALGVAALGEIVVDPAYGAPESSRSRMADWASEIRAGDRDGLRDFFASAIGPRLPAADRVKIFEDLLATDSATVADYLLSEYVDDDAIGLADATRRVAAARALPVLAIHSTLEGAEHESSLPAPAGSVVEHWQDHGHFLHLEDPARFADTVVAWIEHLDRSRVMGPIR